MANEKTASPATADTLYDIGSLAKMFTSTVILQLDAEAKLRLDDPMARYLVDVPKDKAGITVRHLLSHTSGAVANHVDPLAKLDRDAFLAWFLATPLESAPGEKLAYSNVGYSVLAAIVERAIGRPFPDVIRERVFVRADMKDTFFLDDRGLDRKRLARGSGPRLLEFKQDGDPSNYGGIWLRIGPGGIVSNARDLHSWERALRADKVLSAELYARATTP